jgi:hypothetical protein
MKRSGDPGPIQLVLNPIFIQNPMVISKMGLVSAAFE